VGGPGEVAGGGAELVLDRAEEFVVGAVGEGLGHPAQRVVGGGSELAEEGLDAGRAVVGGAHGTVLAIGRKAGFGSIPATYPNGGDFSPTNFEHTPSAPSTDADNDGGPGPRRVRCPDPDAAARGPVMSDDQAFRDLIARVRAGDAAAAAELVCRYEPVIRRTIRVRLRDPRLRRLLDSMDVCQSVLASFFVRAALGQYDLDDPGQLQKLLAALARNKLAGQAQHHQAARRDFRRAEPAAAAPEPAGRDPSPGSQLAAAELLAEARRRLTPEERQLLDWRQEGRDWAAIAAELGCDAAAARMRLKRATDRVAGELGLDEVADE
jgi:RNA polymerase sigma-70 factor (ECF subfamily)